MKNQCSSCQYWKSEPIINLSAFTISYKDGFCKRYPPAYKKRWPITSHDDGCGEHSLKPPSAEEMFVIQKPRE